MKFFRYKIFIAILVIFSIIVGVTACKDEPEPDPDLKGTVSISGIAKVGQTLTADTVSLVGSGTITYQWKRGNTIIGTNSSTYVVQTADVGSTITVTVTCDGFSGSVTSRPTATVTNEPSPPPQTFLLYGYDVINSAYINRDDVKFSAPIINIDKANKEKLIIQTDVKKSTFELVTANSIKDLYNKLSGGMSVQGSYGLFSAKVDTEFSVENGGKRTNYFSKGRSIQQTKDEWLKNSEPAFLKDFFTDEFINDITGKTAGQFIEKYGTHLIKRVYWGGTAEFNYSYYGTALKTETEIKAAVEASYGEVKGEVNAANKSKVIELNNNSKFYVKTVGGKNTGIMNVDGFTANYRDWVDSVANQPDICAIGNFRDCLLPLWELVAQVDPAKAQAVETEFNKLLKKRENELEIMGSIGPEPKPYIYNLSVGEIIPAGYNYVNNGPAGSGYILDANSQVKNGSKVVRIGYKKEINANNHLAIAEIKVVDGRNNTAPNLPAGYNYNDGWRAVYSDLNLGNSGIFRYIIYRLVNENDKYAIDNIGAYDNFNQNDGHDLAGMVGWNWVTWYNSSNWANLNYGVGGNYVYLTVHKSPFTWTVE